MPKQLQPFEGRTRLIFTPDGIIRTLKKRNPRIKYSIRNPNKASRRDRIDFLNNPNFLRSTYNG